jgi:hypothetical protein
MADCGFDQVMREKHFFCNLSPGLELRRSNIRALALGESIDEYPNRPPAQEDNRPEPSGLSFALAPQSLFEDATSEIGVDIACVQLCDGAAQLRIGDPVLSTETREFFALEDSQREPELFQDDYNTECYRGKGLFDDAALAVGDEVGEVAHVSGLFGRG